MVIKNINISNDTDEQVILLEKDACLELEEMEKEKIEFKKYNSISSLMEELKK